ncbi:MAG: TIGR02117 family protein [Microscillaceae bacterium]|nr:TIGR02117 family protein [Microscillaceae bacterium]
MAWIWILGACLLVPPGFVLAYLFVAALLKRVPANRKARSGAEGISIWVVSNGPHSDIIVPLWNELIDWRSFFDLRDFQAGHFQFISFGWGDKGFYLETPSWGELKPKTAFKALFKLSTTTMQVSLHEKIGDFYKWKKELRLSDAQYLRLGTYIKNSFYRGPEGKALRIDFAGMPAYEHLNYNFYEAIGQYHFFKTCNVWVNDALKVAQVRTATWAPFSEAIFHQLDKYDGQTTPRQLAKSSPDISPEDASQTPA